MRYSPSKRADRAARPPGARPSAPPRWRSSREQQRRARLRRARRTRRAPRRRARRASRVVAGVRHRLLGVHVDAAEHGGRDASPTCRSPGSSARSAASAAAPASAPPAYAPSITTTERPRRNAGSSGSGGRCMIRIDVVISSGAVRVQACQARSTSACALVRATATCRRRPRRRGTAGTPSRSRRRSCRRRRAAPRTGRRARRRSRGRARPSGVTSSIAVTLLAARPCLRASQLRPPPSV